MILNKLNSPDIWDKLIAKNFEYLPDSHIYRYKNKIVLGILEKTCGPVLDVGFGYGYIEEMAQKLHFKNLFNGIDISPYAVKRARQKLKGIYKLGNIAHIPFGDSSFNTVVVLDVLEHIYKKDVTKGYQEIIRVLRPGGKLIVSVPLNENSSDKRANRHVRLYSALSIVNELGEFGFSVEKTRFLYAFKYNFLLKNIIIKFLPFGIRKPNLIIVIAKLK